MSATTSGTPPDGSPADGLRLVIPGRRAPIGAGARWIGTGWRLFAKSPLMWLLGIVLFFVFSVIISLVPFLGSAIVQVLNPVYSSGFSLACRSLEKGGEFELEHLLAGFRLRFGPLAILGLIFLAGTLLILLVFAVIAGFSLLGAFLSGKATPDDIASVLASSALSVLLGSLVAVALWIPLLAAYWFAPTLVILHDMAPVAAMKASFFACFRNFWVYAVYGIIMLAIGLVLSIPTIVVPFVGWLASLAGFIVLYAVNVTAGYAAYRDIFTEESA